MSNTENYTTLLPEYLEENIIEYMVPGEIGYTVPWAMYVETDRSLFIHGGYSVRKESGGTFTMQIERTKTGVIVYANTLGNHTYSPTGEHFVGGCKNPLPVTLILG